MSAQAAPTAATDPTLKSPILRVEDLVKYFPTGSGLFGRSVVHAVDGVSLAIQAQIVNLMEDLQEKFQLTFLFIAHDLSVVRHISDRIAVMYLGKIVEIGPSASIRDRPLHPYTKVLESSVPVPDPDIEATRKPILLKGEIPSPVNPPSGCRFHTRCPIAQQICTDVEPPLEMKESGRFAACHFAGQL